MKILAFADIHDGLKLSEIDIYRDMDFDMCIVLGDIDIMSLEVIKDIAGDKVVIGVHGNHDPSEILLKSGIEDIHCLNKDVNGVRFVGFSGCLPYKQEENIYLYSQMQCSMMLDNWVDSADIIISHNSPYGIHDKDDFIHTGYKGIEEYILKHNPKYCIHGHQHINKVTVMDNGTKVIGVYGISIIDIDL